jgi:hypothetical protein
MTSKTSLGGRSSALRRRKAVGAFAVFTSIFLPFPPSSSYVSKRPCQTEIIPCEVVAAPAVLDRAPGAAPPPRN